MREDQAYQLDQAIRSGDDAAVKDLLAHEPRLTGTPIPVARDWGEEMWLGLHVAVQAGHAGITAQLLDAGATPDARTRFRTPMHGRQTALMLAVCQRHADVAGLLLQRGADAELLDANHRSALSYAAEHGGDEVLGLLLERGVPVDPVDDQDRTPLHWAIAQGRADTAIALIEAGADVDHTCPKEPAGYTPLHRCASAGHAMDRVAQRLHQAGADTTLADPRFGRTAQMLAGPKPST